MSDLLKTLIEAKTQERTSIALMGSFLKATEESLSEETYEHIKTFTLNWLKDQTTTESNKQLLKILKDNLKNEQSQTQQNS
jgi:hypothetical protein